MRRLLDAFGEAGVSAEKVERFLEGEPSRGGGSVRDHIASEMANQLLDALGQKSSQDPVKTKKLRELGAWRDYDRWPED